MSLWLEILKHASVGDSVEARRLLNFELPQVLRWAEGNRAGDWRDNGPVSKIVRIFIASLGETDRGMAKSRSEDFVDYISDLIVAKVRRTVSLVEFCREYPEMSIVQIAERFTGWDGLKLGQEDRINWVRKHLRSMSSAGIEISSAATEEARTAPTNEDYDPFWYNKSIVANEVEISDDVYIVSKETVEQYKEAKTQPVSPEPPPSPGPGPKPPTPTDDEEDGGAGPTTMTNLKWEGEVPAQKWMTFYNKVLSKYAVGSGLKIRITIEANSDAGISSQKVDETKVALRELGLDDDLIIS